MDSYFSDENSTEPPEKLFLRESSKLDMDIKIIEKLVEETVDKLTFAMTMPCLVSNDCALIKSHINDNQLENIQQVLNKFSLNNRQRLAKQGVYQNSLASLKSVGKIQEYFNSYSIKTENIPQREEYEFSNALLVLFQNDEVKKISENYNSLMSEAGFNFIQEMKLFFFMLLEKMRLTPQEAERREAYLRKLCYHHQNLSDESHLLELQAIKEIRINKERLKEKLSDVLNIKDKINKIMQNCEYFVQKSGRDADKKMIFDWKNSEYRQEILQEKVNKEIVDLEFLRKKYVQEEKELRTKRFKMEQNLISFLEQYDRDMQKKQDEVEAQQETLRSEKEQFDQLQEKYEEQKAVYDLIMEEKRDYEKRLFEAKLYEFKCNSAARKIQRFYRSYKKLVHLSGRKDHARGKKKRKK